LIEFRRRLKAEWWKTLVAAVAAIFAFSATAVLRPYFTPVGPGVLEAFLALVALAAALALLALFAEEFAPGTRVLRPYHPALAYAALGFGTLLGMWLFAGFPLRHATDSAYLDDPACVGNPANPVKSERCTTVDAKVLRAWTAAGGYDAPGYLTLALPATTQTVQLTCPGSSLVTTTARAAGSVSATLYHNRVSRIAGGGLLCETSFAPSLAITAGDVWFGLFGLIAALYAAWVLWGSRLKRRRRMRSIAAQGPAAATPVAIDESRTFAANEHERG
jgi:hypothetical protein